MSLDSIGLRIKELRKKENLTQDAFAEKLGVNRAVITQIERQKQLPTLTLVSKIAKFFDVAYSWLIDGIDACPDSYSTLNPETGEFETLPTIEILKTYEMLVDSSQNSQEGLLKMIRNLQDNIQELSHELNEFHRSNKQAG